MKCPECNGEKEVKIFPKLTKSGKVICTIPCDRCNQTGEVPKEMEDWIEVGKHLRNTRRSAKLTLRAFSEKTGVDALTISKAERGIIDPIVFANMAFENFAKKGKQDAL